MTPAFADPVFDAQTCFRAVLDATARPGTIHTVTAPAHPPAPLHRASAAVLLTLLDAETTFAWDGAPADALAWLGFHCGVHLVPRPEAAFVLSLGGAFPEGLRLGTDDVPEDGATLILQLPALGTGPAYRLSGPGLREPATLGIEGLPPGFAPDWAANTARFPRGIDLVLCSGDRLAALPRTTRVEPL